VVIRAKYNSLKEQLDERTRRLWAAAEANALGHGGTRIISRVTGLSEVTIRLGRHELASSQMQPITQSRQGIRRSGGGRKSLTAKHKGLLEALDALVEPTSRGEPNSPLRWTCKSTRKLETELRFQGFHISHVKISHLLKELGYSLQSTLKRYEGSSHSDRNETVMRP